MKLIFDQSSEIIKPISSFQMAMLILIVTTIAAIVFYIKSNLSIKNSLEDLRESYGNIIKHQKAIIENINRGLELLSGYSWQERKSIDTDKLYCTEELEMYFSRISCFVDENYIDDIELKSCVREMNRLIGLLQKETDHFTCGCKSLFIDNSSIVGRVALEANKSRSIENYRKLEGLKQAKSSFSIEMAREAKER